MICMVILSFGPLPPVPIHPPPCRETLPQFYKGDYSLLYNYCILRVIVPFLACGDLSAYDSDRTYGLQIRKSQNKYILTLGLYKN